MTWRGKAVLTLAHFPKRLANALLRLPCLLYFAALLLLDALHCRQKPRRFRLAI
jgi:hypothetical protein